MLREDGQSGGYPWGVAVRSGDQGQAQDGGPEAGRSGGSGKQELDLSAQLPTMPLTSHGDPGRPCSLPLGVPILSGDPDRRGLPLCREEEEAPSV